MKKTKIIGSRNTDDSLWLKLVGNIETLDKLDAIFNIYELVESKDKSYESWIKNNPNEFYVDEPNCLVYIILTQRYIHLILRKTKGFEKVKKMILDYFSF